MTCYQRRRGIGGISRWIWLGDYLPPQVRQSMDELDEAQEVLENSQKELELLEISIQRIQLESVDDNGDDEIIIMNSTRTETESNSLLFQHNPALRTRIGMFSNSLDHLAASIDSIKSHSDHEVKQRKKKLSNGIVNLMNDLDSLIAPFDARLEKT